MIKFQAKPSSTNQQRNYNELLNEKLAEQLNEQALTMSCPEHPGSITIVQILGSPVIRFEVAVCCCSMFGKAVLAFLQDVQTNRT